jgi:catechol 2,3-dioxygenase-like lactoylglutathione lyase family enzyme
MNQIALALAVAACLIGSSLAAQDKPTRPHIIGIHHVRIYVRNLDKSRYFYAKILGLPPTPTCPGTAASCFAVITAPWVQQQVELVQAPSPAPKNWLAEVAFLTESASQMRAYLVAHGLKPGMIVQEAHAPQHFELLDPEGNRLSFVELRGLTRVDDLDTSHAVSMRLFHAGFVVRSLDVENRFYHDVLGFRLYWQGGFKDDGLDWYEIQVANGDDWIEFMLNIPTGADHKELGVQNHFSLGVADIHATAQQLRKNGLQNFDGPEIGRDGKWALDAYDPDGTRVELMEFTPTKEPCCHPYTADHPKP